MVIGKHRKWEVRKTWEGLLGKKERKKKVTRLPLKELVDIETKKKPAVVH